MPEATVTSQWSTSSDLLSRVRERDQAAWARFVALYAPLVYGWCRRAGASPADAADVVQDVFAKVFTAIEQFRHDRAGDTLRGWLRVICRNKLVDHLRKRADEPTPTGGTDAKARLAEVPAGSESPLPEDDEPSQAGDRAALVRRAADMVRNEFEPRTWQAFWAMAVDGLTAADAAEKLGISAGAVRQAKYAVSRRLREELAGEFD
ncbi:MAG: sigma-70 family RNA polymerase sigma factor [Planctomycetaceae bacterium]|nr:sigma-70 family RNA polymerase sigma factor [Planctomycetaceae bacterium]